MPSRTAESEAPMLTSLPASVATLSGEFATLAASPGVKWSHPLPPPPVGARLHVPVAYEDGPLGEVEVVGYSVEFGWLALMVRKEGGDRLRYVYGVDLLGR